MADQTSIQEAAQALFCAMADYTGASQVTTVFDSKTHPTYTSFKDMWNKKNKSDTIKSIFDKHVHAPGVSLSEIEFLFAKDVTWYASSVSIAKQLILEIDDISKKFNKIKTPHWTDIYYVRGDSDIMKNIEAIFKVANGVQSKIGGMVLGDINKWSPADIYFASVAAKTSIAALLVDAKKNPITFTKMNSSINKLIVEGHLLPVSLKKQPGQVHIHKVNFDRNKELTEIQKYGYLDTSDWKLYKKEAPQTRDLKIFFDAKSKKSYIKTRHDASSNVLKTEVEVSGALARGGSIGSAQILSRLIGVLDPGFASRFQKAYDDGQNEFKKRMKEKDMETLKAKDRKKYDTVRGEYSAMMVTNKIFPMYMKWLKEDKKRSDAYIQLIYQYITSRTEVSGRFIIAK
jgi:hypothetical protein